MVFGQRLPVYFEFLYAHQLEYWLFFLAFLSLNENGFPISVSSSKSKFLQRHPKTIRMKLILFLKPDMNIFDLKFQVVDYFLPQFVKHALLLISILDLLNQQFIGLFDVLVQQLLLGDLIDVSGMLLELDNDKNILYGAGNRNRGQFGERSLNKSGVTSMLSLPIWLKATLKGVSRELK